MNFQHNYEYFLLRENLNYGQFGEKYTAIKVSNEMPLEIKNSCQGDKDLKIVRKA